MKTITTEEEIYHFAVERWGHKSVADLALKLSEESGEVAGVCIKRGERRSTLSDLDNEIGDVLIVLSQMASLRGQTLEELRASRFLQIKARFEKL